MIPRLKPYLDHRELGALFDCARNVVPRFEGEFAHAFDAKHGIAYPYGRTALWALLRVLGIQNAEVIMPAYTCVVVAHAIVLSGNHPRFVDITLRDYNMDLDQVEAALNERTRVVIATHLFGYPLDVDRLAQMVHAAEVRYGHKIWIVQDCAHAFGARWQGKLVCGVGDVALFGLNISKTVTSIFGGMLTTDNSELARKLRRFRDEQFVEPGLNKKLRRILYLLTVYPAFSEALSGFVHWLQTSTTVLDQLTRAYHLDDQIHFPPDYLDRMVDVEARIGIVQLTKYPEIVDLRSRNVHYYQERLQNIRQLALPPLVDGATYSHYVVRVPDRGKVLPALARHGIELGQLIEYSVPHMAAYAHYNQGHACPNSRLCSRTTINLPIYAGLKPKQCDRIATSLVAEVHKLGAAEL